MFIKNIKLKNYKCFKNLNDWEWLEFTIPNWNIGSWLNILIWENNTWKTALLSSITKLKDNSSIYSTDKYLWNDVEINIEDNSWKIKVIKNIVSGSNINKSENNNINFSNLDYIKDNKIWTSDFSTNPNYDESNYQRSISFDRKQIDSNLSILLSSIEHNKPNKKNEINKLLTRIIPKFNDWTIESHPKHQSTIVYKMDNWDKADIDFSLWSGILNLFRMIVSLVDENKNVLLIDEPEAFLHPSAQIELQNILLEKSKEKQIIITTHSPYFFKNVFKTEAELFIFNRNEGNKIVIQNTKDIGWGLFWKNSPTWWEINYYAYNLPTLEFHIELFNHLKSIKWEDINIKSFDNNFFIDEIWLKKLYPRYHTQNSISLHTHIRNIIHHWDSIIEPKFESLFKESIEWLLSICDSLK